MSKDMLLSDIACLDEPFVEWCSGSSRTIDALAVTTKDD